MMRKYWCPQNVDAQAQFEEAMRKLTQNGDDILFHAHGIDEPCPTSALKLTLNQPGATVCWSNESEFSYSKTLT